MTTSHTKNINNRGNQVKFQEYPPQGREKICSPHLALPWLWQAIFPPNASLLRKGIMSHNVAAQGAQMKVCTERFTNQRPQNVSLGNVFAQIWILNPGLNTVCFPMYGKRLCPLKFGHVKYVSKVCGQLCDSRKSYIASVTIKCGICESGFGVFSFKSCVSQLSVDQISRNLVHF